jgi:hypothetical protein
VTSYVTEGIGSIARKISIAELLSERTTPELRYLEAKWAALLPYGVTVKECARGWPVVWKYAEPSSLSALEFQLERTL